MIDSIERRQIKEKNAIVEMLRKTPIVQIVCERNGVSRATYYRWRKEDPEFAKSTDEALAQGTLLINDLAESKLITSIQDQNMTAIIFWLKNHHSAYTPKLELTRPQAEELTEEQMKTIEQTLRLTGISKQKKKTEK
jgi:hypothetical protein